MSLTTTSPVQRCSPLPPPPQTVGILIAVRDRLRAIEADALPELQRERAILSELWYSDDPEAILIHLDMVFAIPCNPIGVDRIATVVAHESALLREASALRDLERALEDYEGGGRKTLAELDGEAQEDSVAPLEVYLMPRPGTAADPRSISGRERTRRLRAYLALIERELARATDARQLDQAATLVRERDAVRGHLERWLVPPRRRARGLARRASGDDRAIHSPAEKIA